MILSFAFIIAIMVAANGYLLFELELLLKAARETLSSNIQAVDLAKRLQSLLNEEERSAQKYIITRDKTYYDLFKQASRQFQQDLNSLAQLESGQEQLLLIQQASQKHEWLLRSLEQTPARRSKLPRTAMKDGPRKESVNFVDESLDRLIKLNQISVEDSMGRLVATTQKSSRVAVIIILFTLLAASTAAWLIARAITRPISEVIQATQRIARGSFEPVRIFAGSELSLLADAVNDMGDQLRKTNELKSDLLHQIVHELRQPLQVIYSAQAILTEHRIGSLNDRQLEMLHLIGENVAKLVSFANQFLDAAKVEAGKMEYRLSAMDLLPVVTRAVADAKILASQKDITVTMSGTSAPRILADGQKLSQVFANLLSNAIKYTDCGGAIEVSISCAQKWARVAVRDSGVGIAAEDLPKLFAKFYQATNASKASIRGSGLGLALVKAFVEAHGGSVSVESAPGIGSTFTVELPLAQEEENPIQTMKMAAEPSSVHG